MVHHDSHLNSKHHCHDRLHDEFHDPCQNHLNNHTKTNVITPNKVTRTSPKHGHQNDPKCYKSVSRRTNNLQPTQRRQRASVTEVSSVPLIINDQIPVFVTKKLKKRLSIPETHVPGAERGHGGPRPLLHRHQHRLQPRHGAAGHLKGRVRPGLKLNIKENQSYICVFSFRG